MKWDYGYSRPKWSDSRININPGSGPLEGTTKENALANIQAFVRDLEMVGVKSMALPNSHGGRWAFAVGTESEACRVDMPGLPIEQVRFMGGLSQDPWQFTRLYVDGSSWLWCYALDIVRDYLTGQEGG